MTFKVLNEMMCIKLAAHLRAFNYYRNAEFFLHTNPLDPRIIDVWQRSVDSFKKA
jgi:hypothetical protein